MSKNRKQQIMETVFRVLQEQDDAKRVRPNNPIKRLGDEMAGHFYEPSGELMDKGLPPRMEMPWSLERFTRDTNERAAKDPQVQFAHKLSKLGNVFDPGGLIQNPLERQAQIDHGKKETQQLFNRISNNPGPEYSPVTKNPATGRYFKGADGIIRIG